MRVAAAIFIALEWRRRQLIIIGVPRLHRRGRRDAMRAGGVARKAVMAAYPYRRRDRKFHCMALASSQSDLARRRRVRQELPAPFYALQYGALFCRQIGEVPPPAIRRFTS